MVKFFDKNFADVGLFQSFATLLFNPTYAPGIIQPYDFSTIFYGFYTLLN